MVVVGGGDVLHHVKGGNCPDDDADGRRMLLRQIEKTMSWLLAATSAG